MVTLHRTANNPPLAVLRCGKTILFPWEDLLTLRKLVTEIPSEIASDEDFPFHEVIPWGISGSVCGIALMRLGCETLYFGTDDWQRLAELLYVGDELLSQVQVAEMTDRSQQSVSYAITAGDMFAFRVPGLKRQQWRIPTRVVEQWID